ncbi:MAG: lipocalin-like domain-containing protein [Thermomicrobiales bacterium]
MLVAPEVTYTADGYMCVAIMDSHSPRFARGHICDATDAERAAVARGYVSYAGRYEVVEGKVLHHVEVSLIPNWLGGTQERRYTLDGDRLTLVAPRGTLIWERVPPRS